MSFSIEITIWVLSLSHIWGAALWCLWQGVIRPRLIPHKEIVEQVETLYARYGDEAFDIACANEHGAWQNCNAFSQGRWQRIREEIMRRERKLGFVFSKTRLLL